ncbi:MAG: hypothetical protein P1V81_07245 [Planctomycetota bacterium]|nr:hypothetical protein [Planctomycetota bacterium]
MQLRLAPPSSVTGPLAALGVLSLFAGTGLAQASPVSQAPMAAPSC